MYRFVSESPRCTVDTAAEALGLDRREAGEAVRDLRELGLLSTAGTGGTGGTAGTCVVDGARDAGGAGAAGAEPLVPHPVDFARVKVLNPLQRQVNRSQALVDELRSSLDQLELRTPRSQHAHCSLEVVHELSDVRRLITGFADECCDEALSSQPGGARVEEVLADSMDRTTRLLGRGVRMRTLYQHTARFSPATLSYVDRVTPLGAQVRTLAGGFPRCIIFDRKIGILPLPDDAKGAVIVRDPQLVAFVAEAFDRVWTIASDLSHEERRSDRVAATSEIQHAIISLLTQGESDKRIAQVVGISLRNCQRHISHIMKSIGARNRLHAGYLLSKEPFGGH
ncbi:LuxR C-terminal-related transcriptional regulator [Streptomyces sp. NPDC000963]|uniref:LuxR C-terminal-related transcriptional regulator n=1 Tax=Streptomyces sp. NPDC007872 TaxID=3364782 RepID=UPI001394E010|nr:LuxR family transcriptional regulator [Streptomyces sp. SID2131]